jgi:type I restriction enzyme S subunit
MMREDWIEVELGNVLLLSSEKHKPEIIEDLFYIGLEHIEKDTGRLTIDVTESTINTIKNKFYTNQILYGKLRPYLNKVYLATQSGVCSTDILVFNVSEATYSKYAFHFMLSRQFVNDMSANTSGVNLPRVSTKYINSYKFPLAPLPEQRAIAAKIEQLFSELDNGIANLKTAKSKLEIYRQAILKQAFEGTNNQDIKFRNGTIGEFTSIIAGNAFKKSEYSSSGIRLFQIANVSFNRIIWDSVVYLPSDYLQDPKLQHLILNDGDLVMALNRPMLDNQLKIGILNKFDTPSILYQRVGKFVLNHNLLPKYLLYFLQSPIFTKWLSNELRGVNIPFINQTKLLAFDKLPVTDIDGQNQIVQEIETRLSVCDKLNESIDQSLEKAQALRQSILKKAFEGKLLSQDELQNCHQQTDWEPAAKLLERVKNKKNK